MLVFFLILLCELSLGQTSQRDGLCALATAFGYPKLSGWPKQSCNSRWDDMDVYLQNWAGVEWALTNNGSLIGVISIVLEK